MKQRKRQIAALVLAGCVALGSVTTPAAGFSDSGAAGKTQITGLTTEYLSNPIGIDTDSVHFGWQMDSNRIGAKQTAYQVRVFAADDGEHVVWDSGKVESDKSTGIVCKDVLQEGTAYQWEVTVWNENQEMYSGRASFETGVTNWQEWKDAEFIRLNASPAAPVFRTEQKLQGKNIKSARLYITALGVYQAYVNGNRVGEWGEDGALTYHHMNPGYGNGTVSLGYQTYDVTPFLDGSDTAAVSVVAGTGWRNGMGSTTSQPALKALLAVTFGDGSRQLIQTNTTDWKGTLAGGITGNGVYYGEDYNACFAEELGDFTQVGYDDSGWVNSEGVVDSVAGVPYIACNFAEQNAAYVRVLVEETGPAIADVRENFLQLMELELLDGQGNNVVAGKVPEVSNTWSPNAQWRPEHLTDGDLGTDTDNGYTTTMFGNQGLTSVSLSDPVSITFRLDNGAGFQTLKMYPRTSVKSVSGNECANYPKKYRIQVSEDGTNWKDVMEDQTESLRNTLLFPETNAVNFGIDFPEKQQAKHVRIAVSETGSAVRDDNENRLQLMELELLDGQTNVAKGVVPAISNNFEAGAQWNAGNLTDGDYGFESDCGYTSDILGYGEQYLKLDQPITIQFDFEQEVNFSELKFYPRTTKDSISYGVCVNYPKVYTVQVSDDGIHWEDAAVNQDQGMVRNTALFQNTRMSTATFAGSIRAQAGIPGKLIDTFDQFPVSAVLYTDLKRDSSYPGGEIETDASYEASGGENLFGNGLTLKKGQTMIVNMGQNLTAVPRIEFEALEGTKVTLRFAEMLNDGSSAGNGATQADGPKGSIYQKSLRGARSLATYIFSGNGRETYQPSMSFFGYQYVQITASDDIKVYSLCSKAISSVTEQTGKIRTNNEHVNKLFSNVLFGQLSNYYTTPTDCNQRDERLSWTGDTQAFAQTAVYNFDSVAFLRDMQDIYDENTWIKGYVPGVADDLNGYFSPWAAGWSDVEILVPWVLYLQTGDQAILTESWDALVHYMEYLQAHERGANQAPASGDRNYGDWLSFQGTSIEVMNDYYYGYMNQIMAKIAKVIGDTEKEKAYNEKFEAIKETFIRTHVDFSNGNLIIKSKEGNVNLQFMHWTDKKGIWENNSQTSLIWMLKLGFYDSEEMRDEACRLLLENIKNENPDAGSVRAKYGKNTLAVGFLGSNVITPVLTESGNADVSYDLLLQDGQPSWLFEVNAGATTVWERWNSYTPGVGFGDSEMNSFNHYAYGSVLEWMYRYMAGISVDEENPGFKNIILQPTLDTGVKYNSEERIDEVEASYDSYYGTIQTSWTSSEGKLSDYNVVIPANTTAVLYLPVDASALKGFKAIKGVSYEGMKEHNGISAAEIRLDSGSYSFEVQDGKLSVAYAGGSIGPDPELPFIDVVHSAENWYYDAVANVYWKDLMTGLSETVFGPSEPLLRAEFAVILHRMEDLPKVSYDGRYQDVADGLWYTDAVAWASEEGVITGYGAGEMFGPGDYISREQMATMMYRYAKRKGYDTSVKADLGSYKDASEVSAFAEEAMQWAVGNKIISGKQEGTILDPQGNTTRSECAVILTRFMDTYNK